MRPDRDIDVLLDAWLAEGPVEAPDRILDTIADRVHRRRPEPAWRLAWRESRMNTVLKPILAAAAIVVLSVTGVAVILNQPGPDIGGPEATPTPVASPSPSPDPSDTALCQSTEPSCLGPLAAGAHQTDRIVTPFTYEVPEGWSKLHDEPGVVNLQRNGWAGFLGIWPDPVAVDQEVCTSNADPSVGRSVDDLVAWLTQHPGLTTTEPARAELGGLRGWTLEAEMREGWEPGPCSGRVSLFSHAGTEVADPFSWDIDADRRMRLTILDAGDHVVMIDIEADKADFDAVVAEAASVVDSFDFETP